MARIPLRFNFGEKLREDNPQLYNQLNDIYQDIANALAGSIQKLVLTQDPSNSAQINKFYDVGDVAVNQTDDTAFMMTSRTTPENVVWTQIT